MKTFERYFLATNRWVLIVMLAVMSIIIFANVVLRYTTNQSIEWAEEVARHMMIWLTFIGCGPVLRYGGHIAVERKPFAGGFSDDIRRQFHERGEVERGDVDREGARLNAGEVKGVVDDGEDAVPFQRLRVKSRRGAKRQSQNQGKPENFHQLCAV